MSKVIYDEKNNPAPISKDNTLFNAYRDYSKHAMFLGEEQGLFDSVNKPFPHMFDLYKQALAQNWSEDEFDFTPCMKEFQAGGDAADMMIETIAFQWEADSVAAEALLPVLAPFISNSEVQALTSFNTYMECCHALAYSEIVRNSFENPNSVIDTIMENKQSIERVSYVAEALDALRKVGMEYQQGKLTRKDVYPELYKGIVGLLLLERLQFIASFAITFAIGESGMFLPIANCVRKICSDEIQIHATADIYMLRELRNYPEWDELCENNEAFHADVIRLVDDVTEGEIAWTEHLFRDGRVLTGVNEQLIKDWVIFNAEIIKEELGYLKPEERTIKENPLPWIEGWLTLNKLQQANQETDSLAYKG